MEIERDVVLAAFTTFHIGGPARFFARVQHVEELREALAFAKEKNLKFFVLGGGSNLLVGDAGFDGLVIKIEIVGIELEGNSTEENKKIVIAGAGESWDALVEHSVAEKLWGLENLSGIPGTVGGAVVQGIGAYGASVGQTLLWAEAFDCTSGEIKKLTNAECAFGYRGSFFKHEGSEYIVLRAAFALSTAPVPQLSYKDIAARFGGSTAPALADIRAAVLEIRKAKFPDLAVEGTAGSFFKNPIVRNDEAERLQAQYPGLPVFALPETQGVKVALAWLLDHVLGLKGTHVGGARLFEKQPLVVAAKQGTRASDVYTLIQHVKKEVQEKIHIEIEEEVKIL